MKKSIKLSISMESDTIRVTSTLVNKDEEMGEPCQEPNPISALTDAHNEAQEIPPLPLPEAQPFLLHDPDELNGEFPIVSVPSAGFAFSKELVAFLYARPAVLLRGLVDSVGIDLKLFSSHEIACTCPAQPLELRRQIVQLGHANCNKSGEPSWEYLSSKLNSTIERYAKYQAESFRTYIKGARENVEGRVKGPKLINFGTNIDLSNEEIWLEQLTELGKLPPFARVDGDQNFLSHVGHPLLGMNTVQLYMKVPGSRTPGHQENNNFCAININMGPEDSEWFAVPESHWKEVQDLCEGKGLKFLSGSWWPNLEDLQAKQIPVLRVIQKPGDFIWINCGTVHWVQAIGFCNNVAWNVGPITGHQYEAAVERYRWNKVQQFGSIVPMTHLSWNLARTRSLRFTEQKLVEDIKGFLKETLQQYLSDSDLLTQKGVKGTVARPTPTDPAPYCAACKVEVFGVFLVELKGSSIHCVQCALRKKENLEGFLRREHYSREELFQTFEAFVSHSD